MKKYNMSKEQLNTAGMEAVPLDKVREANEDLLRHLARALGANPEPIRVKRDTYDLLCKGINQLLISKKITPIFEIKLENPEYPEAIQRYGLTLMPSE